MWRLEWLTVLTWRAAADMSAGRIERLCDEHYEPVSDNAINRYIQARLRQAC